jgi:RecA-family ATPase
MIQIPGVIIPFKPKSADQIMAMDLPPQRHLVKGILSEGCNLLAGKPKMGKSWLALQIGISVSLGKPLFNKIIVQRKGVLYLALEDNDRRIKKRLMRTLKESERPSNLYFETKCPRASLDGLSTVTGFLQSHPDVGLVIIDTLARFRDVPKSNKSTYLEDYGTISSLKKIADDGQITILIIHHLRKMDNSEDPLDNISGTTGLTGATDTNLVLSRDRKGNTATLLIEGRDVERKELTLKFDRDTVAWCLTSPIERLSPERREIVELLQKAKEANKTMSPKEIAEVSGKKGESIRQLLMNMSEDGEIECVGRGAYTIPDNIDHIDDNDHINHNDNN